MTPEHSDAVTFETTLSPSGNNTGIPVPEQVIEQLGLKIAPDPGDV